MRLLPRFVVSMFPAMCLSMFLHDAAAQVQLTSKETKTVAPSLDYTTCEKPGYPIVSLRADEQGTVTLEFLVETDGHVSRWDVVKSSGFPRLDLSAGDAISLCKFKPGMQNGVATRLRTSVQYVWSLGDGPPAPPKTLDQLRVEAEGGNAQAQFEMANRLFDTDKEAARRWLTLASAQNHLPAIRTSGMLLMAGVPPASPDTTGGAALLRKAADMGDAMSQDLLAILMLSGKKVPQDTKGGIDLLRKAIAQNYPPSLANLGRHLLKQGNESQLPEAIRLLQRAAGLGDADAQLLLADCYIGGTGVPKDYARAFYFTKQAALSGSVRAQQSLALMYQMGTGVPRDLEKADQWTYIRDPNRPLPAIRTVAPPPR